MGQLARRAPLASIGTAAAFILAVVAAAAILLGPGAGRARSTTADLTCVGGSFTGTVTPGVSLATQEMSVSGGGNLGSCIVPFHPGITGGTATATGTATGSCLTGGTVSATGSILYNDPAGSTSTFSITATAQFVVGIPVVTGTGGITSGLFAGDAFLGAPLTVNFNPAECASSGGLTTGSMSNVFGTVIL